MKIRSLMILPAVLIILAAAFLSWRDIQKGSEIPDNVLTILDSRCINCHSTGSRAEKAVEKVDFKKWEEYDAIKKIGILNDIKEVVEEGKMPPEKYLDKFPDKALTAEERETIIDWTGKASAKLME